MLRWLPTAFDSIKPPGKGPEINLYPNELASSIDKLTVWINRDLNTGVYKAGFAPNQEAYDEKVIPVFGALNKLDSTIAANGGPFVLGKHLTELDIRVYATIVRFDVVYVQHFKCNLGIIRHDYPYIETWLQHLYWNTPEEFGFQASTNFKHIKENYTKSHYDINPKAITPMGPYPDVPKTKYTDMTVGGVQMPEVIKYADSL